MPWVRLMKNSKRIGIFIGALLITFIFSTAFASAQTECVNCHEDTFTASKVDRRTSCGDCHNAEYIDYHTDLTNNYIDGYGFFRIGTDPVNIGAPEVHIRHIRGGTDGACDNVYCHYDLTEYYTPEVLTCDTCHVSVDHSSHGSPTSTYTCENALCHNKIQTAVDMPFEWNITQTPACDNCHGEHNIIGSHTLDSSSDLDCIDCHLDSYLPDLHDDYAVEHSLETNCSVCHQNTNETVIDAIDNDNINCDACHTLHGDMTVLHTTIGSDDCVKCHRHDANIIITHKENCLTCHNELLSLPATPECTECHGVDGVLVHNLRGKNHH